MRSIPNNAPTNIVAIDERDPNAGNATHTYKVIWGAPGEDVVLQFQHGPRNVPGSTAGLFDDDLLAIVQDRMECFQSSPYACDENAEVLAAVKAAREALGKRLARRVAQGVLGQNKPHTSHPNRPLYGHCPICGQPGVSRERRPDGNDTCAAGHVYPSAKALP
jgi:hypothetical protein